VKAKSFWLHGQRKDRGAATILSAELAMLLLEDCLRFKSTVKN